MPATIELSGLEVHLGGRKILHGLDARLDSRAIGLLGPNGAGKSTLLLTLLGFHRPARGTARVLGLDIQAEAGSLRPLVGFMPENDAFIARMTGIRFVRYFGEISGLPAAVALERAHQTFVWVGLGEARYRALGTYSQGMKQLAKLAQAIVHGPRLLILDEPTNGLDPVGRKRLVGLIREIRDTTDTHLLISSHLLHDVEETCDEVLILREGRVAGSCNLAEERQANRQVLELEMTGAGGERAGSERQSAETGFRAALETLGCACAASGRGRWKVTLPAGVGVREVYRVASERGVLIERLSHRRDSLEDIFMNAMDQAR